MGLNVTRLGRLAHPSRRRTRGVIALAVIVALAMALDAALWSRAARLNAQIDAALIPGAPAVEIPPGGAGQPAELRFAHAAALAASGSVDAASNDYRALQGDSQLGQAARFNGANVLMRQAAVVRASSQPGQAIALLELAKETYREILRAEPDHWPARYNLERAQRLLADPEEAEADPADAARNRERAATTMRGYSPGLP